MDENLEKTFVCHNLEAESATLGSLTLTTSALARKVAQSLTADDFAFPENGKIFEAIAGLIQSDHPRDIVTVRDRLEKLGALESIGGTVYLAQIIGSVISDGHIEHYARIVRGLAQQRRAVQKLRSALTRAMFARDEGQPAEVLRLIAGDLMATANDRAGVDIWSLEEALHKWIDERDTPTVRAMLTGINNLDKYAGVFRPGAYTIVGGRPSQGKSTLCRWMLGKWARQGVPVGLVAVEEDREKIAGNYISEVTGMENDHVAYGTLNENHMAQVIDAVGDMAGLPWWATDAAFALPEVVAAVETLAVQKGCRVVCVDHIHLIQGSKRAENRNVQISEISSALKRLARLHNLVLIVAAQLSRPMKTAGIPAPPELTDLRDSGSLEQDADAVLMLHRTDYYRQKGEVRDHLAEVYIRKNRNGARGLAILREELKYQRFADGPEEDGPF